MELYKREKFSPFSGCLSSILQIVIILAVFWLVSQPLKFMKNIKSDDPIIKDYSTKIQQEAEGKQASYQEIAIIDRIETEYKNIEEQLKSEEVENREELENKKNELNKYRINMEFLGLDLSKVPTQSLNDWKVYVIPGLYVITSFISIRITSKSQKKMQELGKKKDIVVDGDKPEEPDQMESMQQMSNSMMYMMPIMSITIAAVAPLGLALYWLVSNILMIVERLVIDKIMLSKEDEVNDK